MKKFIFISTILALLLPSISQVYAGGEESTLKPTAQENKEEEKEKDTSYKTLRITNTLPVTVTVNIESTDLFRFNHAPHAFKPLDPQYNLTIEPRKSIKYKFYPSEPEKSTVLPFGRVSYNKKTLFFDLYNKQLNPNGVVFRLVTAPERIKKKGS